MHFKVKNILTYIPGIIFLCLFFAGKVYSQKVAVERFEHLNTRQGLSENSVISIYCDKKGYMWFGTMNGLNQYDGKKFKIYESKPYQDFTLTNNRISNIWEDEQGFLWVETYNGYYHYLDRQHNKFYTYPFYEKSEEEKYSRVNVFTQITDNEIWLGSSQSGIYKLTYDPVNTNYKTKHFLSRGVSSLTNNSISFIKKDSQNNVWVGARKGLNLLKDSYNKEENYSFEHFFIDKEFSCSDNFNDNIWFGTTGGTIIFYNNNTRNFEQAERPSSSYSEPVTLLESYCDTSIIAGFENGLLVFYDQGGKSQHKLEFNTSVRSVYVDRDKNVWVSTDLFGIYKVNKEKQVQYYILTPKEIEPLIDDERKYIYEDILGNLWIGLHGAGLAYYNKSSGEFDFFRNNPYDPASISSNFVHCLTNDKSGILWIGTGQATGGVNKLIPVNPAFKNVIPHENVQNVMDNLVRSIFEDSYGNIWMGSKSGKLYIYNQGYELLYSFKNIHTVKGSLPGYNIYTIIQDKDGYIWMGSKGGGISVSKKPLEDYNEDYSEIKFDVFKHNPADSGSLSSNFVYSIIEDKHRNIWIGTYGGGISLLKHESIKKGDNIFERINTSNSNLSNDAIRQIFEDSKGRIWIGTIQGVNLLERNIKNSVSKSFVKFNYSRDDNESISYNDIIHIFEDSEHTLWFGTFGGGINKLVELENKPVRFENYNKKNGLCNDAVFGILEDTRGFLWLSTENGISRFDKVNNTFENYDQNNGLLSGAFSENTCTLTKSGHLLFGNSKGTLVIDPLKLKHTKFKPPVVFTNFQLSNKDVNIEDKKSPLSKSLEYTDLITLNYKQSSFSIEYSALSYFDPGKNEYAFKLDPFDENWNNVGNQSKATYTNLPPGKYTFMIKAANWDGTWNDTPKTLEIVIRPPWWKTKIAFISYLILLIVLGEITRRIISRFMKMRNNLRVERKVNEIKLKFFTNISHELRTPLTLIMGPLTDIRNTQKLPEQISHSIELMYKNGSRMLRLINQLLDFRKIQNEKLKLNIQKVQLKQFIVDIIRNFELLSERKHIKIEFISEIDDIEAWIDCEKFDIVIFNILSNAFKYSPKKSKIEILLNFNEETQLISISIKDKGVGIPKNKIPLVFQRFTTLSEAEHPYKGYGIGLALSYELIKLHHGNIEIESEENKGARFIIQIPAGKQHFNEDEVNFKESETPSTHLTNIDIEMNEAPEELSEADSSEKFKKGNILIVEDNIEIRDYVFSILQENYCLTVASNGKEALEIIQDQQPDALITDVMMPELNGIQLTQKLKENFDTSHIPVIMLTAKSAFEEQIDGIQSGAEAYIIKPFNAKYLTTVLENILKQRNHIYRKLAKKSFTVPDNIVITPRDQLFLEKVKEIISKNYQDPDYNVERLVEDSLTSRTVFYNKLKGLTGYSPVDFLRRMRLEIARKLLEESGENVSTVAYQTGFNDAKYFSKCFKELFGISPAVIKNKVQQSE